MVKKILITGVSGLVGGILIEHLLKNPNYDIYGIDKHIGLSILYQIENIQTSKEQQPILPSKEKFYICDITDRDKLLHIIVDNQINIIIHLAAVLEMETVDKINRVNCDAKNIKPLQSLKKITINDSPIPNRKDPLREAYSISKIYGEALARQYSLAPTNKVKFVSARLGTINTIDDMEYYSFNWAIKSIYCSYRDLCQFIDRVLENQSRLKNFQIYFVLSNNDYCWVDMDNGREDLNYMPQDGARWN
ncbi:unnamed protein product [Rotaria sp. Silwood1]|nr:unnamed protein product [Rotaria sp. Silwood1]